MKREIDELRKRIENLEKSKKKNNKISSVEFTKEYELSYFTKNLNSWRNDFGNETYWQNILGEMFIKQNKGMWEFLN